MTSVISGSARVLGGIALLGMAGVALVHSISADRIEAVRQARQSASLQELLPLTLDKDPVTDSLWVTDPLLGDDEPRALYRAWVDGQLVGSVISAVAPDGYSGVIELLVSVYTDGRLGGVRVTDHRETPGLGDAIDTRRSDWILQFSEPGQLGKGKGRADSPIIALRRDGGDYDAITGATITSTAIIDTVRDVHRWYQQHAAKIESLPIGEHWLPGVVE